MLNTKFIVMKKPMLLIFLFCIFVHPIFANTTNFDGDLDLSLKIKKGDTWNMVFKLDGPKITMNNFKDDSNSSVMALMGMDGLGNLRATTNWEVECLDSFEEKVVLKFTFRRLELKSTMIENGKKFLNYNDTDFPLNLSPDKMDQINQFLNKSFTCEIPRNPDEEIKIRTNGFENESIKLPTTTFMNTGTSKLFKISFGLNSYAFVGPNAVLSILNMQRSIFPENPVEIGDSWMSDFVFEGDTVSRQMMLKSFEEGVALINTTFDGETEEIAILPDSGLPLVFDLSNLLKVYSYNTPVANTHISGDFQNKELNGIATFTIKYPVTSDKIEVEVKNGAFKMPIDLMEPVSGVFTFQDTETDFFLTPGINVKINWKNGKAKAEGFGADDLNAVFLFSGNPLYFGYSTEKNTVKNIKEKSDTYLKKIESILNQFKGRLSLECERYIKTESNFRIASWYVNSIEDIEREKAMPETFGKNFDPEIADENYNFFMNKVDSIPLLGSVSFYSEAYHNFIMEYLKLKQRDFLYELGRRRNDDNFRENLMFAAIQYVGYPFYYSSFKILESQILEGNAAKVETELDDFFALPCNPVFKNALNHLIDEMNVIEPGRVFPFTEIVDIDGEIQKIPRGELCIVDLRESFSMQKPQHKDEMEELTRIIKEDSRIDKINYVVVRAHFAKGKMIETPGNDTVNFKHIYLPENDISLFEKSQVPKGDRRILLLDKDHKIINNNLERIEKYSGHDFPKVLDDYFESLNKPTSQAGNSRLLLVLLVSLIGFGFLSWLLIRIRTKQIRKKEAARRKLSELELKAIRSQMNPHFIFNAMGSIQNLINHNNIKNANLYLSRFARLMRMVLDNSNKKLVSLAEELELLKNYLMLEQLRIDFTFDIQVDSDIEPETEEIPGMLVQPFVENAVIHGITPKGKGNIEILFSKQDNVVVCEIIDDGVGIEPAGVGSGNGMAMKLSEKRLNLLNSQLQTKLRLKVENRLDYEKTEGTKITLVIPVG